MAKADSGKAKSEDRKVVKLIKRRCSRCEQVWLVDPKKQFGADLRNVVSTLNVIDSVDEGALSRSSAQNAMLNAENLQRNLKTCPDCGADKYEESDFFFDEEDQEALRLLSGIKKCPECAEMIKMMALKCKHCGHQFSDDDIKRINDDIQKLDERSKELGEYQKAKDKIESKQAKQGCLGLVILIVVVITIIGLCTSRNENKTSWYEGGTLHSATVVEWKAASESDKLATAADWLYNAQPGWKAVIDGDPSKSQLKAFKEKSKLLSGSVDTAISETSELDTTKAAEIALMLIMMSSDIGPEENSP